MIGRVFNERYRITERVGIGGMAEVYKAQDQVLGRTVAVKVMLPQYAADPEFASRFRQEAASAANLQSPYIVNVYDWGQDNGTYFIVMEFVRGVDLKSAIEQRGAINPRKVAEIGSQVCQALTVAHNLDIIHRDIKPQNIMVQPDGNVKVMDFGIARAKNSVKAKTSSVLGTAHYISPEQAQGKDLTYTSDIYSLGCVLYEAATGKLPFDGPDAVSVAMKQVSENPVPPADINPAIPPDLEAIILKAMEKDPQARFQTAREMRTCLDSFIMGRPVVFPGYDMAQAATTVMPTQQTSYDNQTPGGTAVMPVIDNARSSKASSYRTDSGKKKKMSTGKKVGIAVAIIAALAIVGALAFAMLGNSNEQVSVPDVTNMSQTSAEAAITAEGLTIGTVTEDYSTTVSEGNVISTDPVANTKVDKGSAVNLVVSKGQEMVEVPDITGMSASQAQSTLQQYGLTATYAGNEASDTVDSGLVTRQDAAAGTKVSAGTAIRYWISTGIESIDVPNVTGMSESAATTALKNAGFNVMSTSGGTSDEYDEGEVMSQTPNGGKLEKGGTVTIYISQGSSSVEVPNVVGESESTATRTIANSGLRYDVQYRSSSSAEQGVVISQSPNAGNKADQGDTVTLIVSSGSSSSSNGSSSSSNSGSYSGSGTNSKSNL